MQTSLQDLLQAVLPELQDLLQSREQAFCALVEKLMEDSRCPHAECNHTRTPQCEEHVEFNILGSQKLSQMKLQGSGA